MKSLTEFARPITNIAAERWNIAGLEARFIPWCDDFKFDLTSDFCIKLARVLRQNPTQIAKQLTVLTNQRIDARFVDSSDYLCYSGPSDQQWLGQAMLTGESPAYSSYLLLLPPATATCCGWSYLRLAALGLFQAISLRSQGCDVTFAVSGLFKLQMKTRSDLFEVMRSLFFVADRIERVDSEAILAGLKDHIDPNGRRATNIWLVSDTLPLKALRILIDIDGISSFYAEKNWLRGIIQQLQLDNYKDFDCDQLLSIFVCLAGASSGSDLSPEMAQFNGTDNLLWYTDVVRQRTENILENGSFEVEEWSESIEIGVLERNLAIRLKFLQCFWELAGIRGNVRQFFTAFNDVLRLATILCNDPSFRRQIHQGEQGRVIGQILSGGVRLLSDIMLQIRYVT